MRSHDREEMAARVREALGSLDPISMSETERSDLRRAVWSEIRSADPAPEPAPVPWRQRLVGAVAVLAVVVGGVAMLDGASGDGDADALFALSADEGSATTVVAAEDGDDRSTEDFRGGAVEQPETHQYSNGGGQEADPISIPPDLTAMLRRSAENLRTGGFTPLTAPLVDCPARDELEGLTPFATVTVGDTDYQAWKPDGEEVGPDTTITFVDPGTCEVVASE